MKTIYFESNVPKILATKALARIWPNVFFSKISPVVQSRLPDRDLPGPNWVRVENTLAGICGTDISFFFVRPGPKISLAAMPGTRRTFLGHEIVGRVVETGPGVSDFAPGERVTLQRYLPCCSIKEIDPPCGPCSQGLYVLCENFAEGEMPPDTGAGFSDHFVAHRSQLLKVPDDMSDDQAVLIEPAAVSVHAVLKRPPKAGEKVLVIGAGTIGLNVIQAARAVCPDCVIHVSEPVATKRDLALSRGADHALAGDPYQAVQAATGARLYRGPLNNRNLLGGFDLVYDCVGTSNTIHHCLRWIRARGDYVMIGNHLCPVSFDPTPLWQQEINVIGINAHNSDELDGRKASSFAFAMEMIQAGKIDLTGFITHRFALERYLDAFRLIRDQPQAVIKAVFEMPGADN